MENNPVLKAVFNRRSVRKYIPGEPATREELMILVKAGMAAPSACNCQPWEFIILDDPAVTSALADAHPYAGYLHDAQSAIVVCGNLKNAYEPIPEYWIQDCSAATENILLAAEALSLATVWCGVYPNLPVLEKVRTLLALPANAIPLSLIVIGHSAEPGGPVLKYNSQKIHFQRW